MAPSPESFSGLLQLTEYDTRTNARLKIYPSQVVKQVSNVDLFKTGDFELASGSSGRTYNVPPKGEAEDPERSARESCRRARAAVRDIALCNHFTHFFTLTLDGSLIDRYSPEIVYDKLRTFLSHAVARKGFQYLVVPEYHKLKEDEKEPAIHLHGLCCLGDLKTAFSGHHDEAGRPIYNVIDWKFGFSTCIPLDEDNKAAGYVAKYIGKGTKKIFGKYYLSSRGLKKRPDIVPLERESFEDFKDEIKLEAGQQFESNVYNDVLVISETFQ